MAPMRSINRELVTCFFGPVLNKDCHYQCSYCNRTAEIKFCGAGYTNFVNHIKFIHSDYEDIYSKWKEGKEKGLIQLNEKEEKNSTLRFISADSSILPNNSPRDNKKRRISDLEETSNEKDIRPAMQKSPTSTKTVTTTSSSSGSSSVHPMINGGCLDYLPQLPTFPSFQKERIYRKRMLACAFRIFSKNQFDEGVAGHITVRDPEYPNTFWVNGFGVDFSEITVSNLIRCDCEGRVIEGGPLTINRAAFAIHSTIHRHRPDVVAAAHSHSLYGKTWSTLGRLLDPITQDSCAFYEDHGLYNSYGGVAFELSEGERIAQALGEAKAVILQNHGLLTVGKDSLEECIWWFISMEKCCKVQLLAEAASQGKPLQLIPHEAAKKAYGVIGTPYSGWYQCQMLIRKAMKEFPDCLT